MAKGKMPPQLVEYFKNRNAKNDDGSKMDDKGKRRAALEAAKKYKRSKKEKEDDDDDTNDDKGRGRGRGRSSDDQKDDD
jgi:hypothetical protein